MLDSGLDTSPLRTQAHLSLRVDLDLIYGYWARLRRMSCSAICRKPPCSSSELYC
jgi:hypothetical protein